MKTSNECNKEKRAAEKALGKVELRVWVYPSVKQSVKDFADKANKKYEKLKQKSGD